MYYAFYCSGLVTTVLSDHDLIELPPPQPSVIPGMARVSRIVTRRRTARKSTSTVAAKPCLSIKLKENHCGRPFHTSHLSFTRLGSMNHVLVPAHWLVQNKWLKF